MVVITLALIKAVEWLLTFGMITSVLIVILVGTLYVVSLDGSDKFVQLMSVLKEHFSR